MKTRSCANCYFCEECGRPYICSSFSPLVEVDITDRQIDYYIERERVYFHKRFWAYLEEEDRLQDYFG